MSSNKHALTPIYLPCVFVLLVSTWSVACSDEIDDGGSNGTSDTSDYGGRTTRDTGGGGDVADNEDTSSPPSDTGNTTPDGPRIGDSGPTLPPLGSECDPSDESSCADNLECYDGFCRSRECVAAANARSYLGCDYLAADLPNLAYAPMGGTPDSPLGVVLANSSPNLPAPFWVNDAIGNPAELIAEVTVAPPNIPGIPTTTPVTVFSMLTDNTGAIVEERFGTAQGLEIPGGGMAVILLPHHGYLEESRVSRQAYQIRTERPVAAYQFGPYCCNYSFTNDASLLLPVATLGTEYRYVGVPSWAQAPDPMGEPAVGLPAYLTVIGTRPSTVLTINLPAGVEVQPDPGGRITVSGSTVTVTLGQAEVMHLASATPTRLSSARPLGVDLTGARISSTWPVAVFSGHECTYYPQDQEACDHLEEQLFPVDTWGNEFALVPPVLRTRSPDTATEAIFWKMVADRDGTVVTLSVPFADLAPRQPGFDGVPYCGDMLTDLSSITLNEGEFCEFGTRDPVAVTGNLPFQVMGIISGQASTGFSVSGWGQHAGDPAIFLVPPLRQFRLDYQFMAPTTYYQDFVTVIVPPDANLTLDGETVDLRTGVAVPGQNLVFRHLLIDDGPHELRSSREFGIQVFAWDDYVSYAFTGGLNLTKRPE